MHAAVSAMKTRLAHCSHVGLEAKRKGPGGAIRPGRNGGYGTNQGTKEPDSDIADSQVIAKIGGRHGIRTHDLLVANEALSQLS
jgi:hypothetical protein